MIVGTTPTEIIRAEPGKAVVALVGNNNIAGGDNLIIGPYSNSKDLAQYGVSVAPGNATTQLTVTESLYAMASTTTVQVMIAQQNQ